MKVDPGLLNTNRSEQESPTKPILVFRLKRRQMLTTMGTMGDDLTSFGRSSFGGEATDRGGSGKKRKSKGSSQSHGKKSNKFKKRKF